MITEIIRYVTDDGVEHQTRDAAEAHEAVRSLADELYKQTSADGQVAYDVAEYLLRHYTLTPKEQA